MERPDDAGVYRLTDELALIQTLDFFTPIVDDPYTFGQITVANALSDVYAMGGTPRLAMNIICFPVHTMDLSILKDILEGGLDKMNEAGVLLVGGHSVEDDELKYGLSVTGLIHPAKVRMNSGARPGDHLVLTKPLGTGIIATAIKAELTSPQAADRAAQLMRSLNRIPAERMQAFDVHACTDVTGFGLVGHACEMVEGTDVGLEIHAPRVPVLDEVSDYAAMGLIPGGAYRNEDFRRYMVTVEGGVTDDTVKILHDPQTSGGLLIALPAPEAEALLSILNAEGLSEACLIGEITPAHPGRVLIRA